MALRKLSDADKQEILKLYHEPEHTTSTLAERYGVSNSTISRLLKARLPEEEYGALILQKRAAAEQAAAEAAAQRAAAKAAAKAASEEKPSKQRSRKGTKPQPKAKETPKPSTKKAKTKDKPVEKADAKPVKASTEPEKTESAIPPTEEKAKSPEKPKLKSKSPAAAADATTEATPEPESSTESVKTRRRRRSSASSDDAEQLSLPEATETDVAETVETSAADEDLGVSAEVAADLIDEEFDSDETDDDYGDEDDFDTDEDTDEEDWEPTAASYGDVRISPLTSDALPKLCYLVVDRSSADLVTCPLKEFSDLGQIPEGEQNARTLPIFDNHRVARRFSRRNQRVIKVPDGGLLQTTSSYLQAKGITRLLIDGQVYTIESEEEPVTV